MRRSLFTHGVCLLAGVVLTLASVLWLQHAVDYAVAEGGGAAAPSGNGDVNGDGRIDIGDPILLLNWLFLDGRAPEPIECSPPGGGALSATGQTECYGLIEDEWVTVPCEGAEIPGQDGAYQAGCPMAGRFVDNGDGTVTDTRTGLMWQQDTADVDGDGTIDPIWGGTDTLSWRDALAYCEGLSFAGHDDWRLPNVRELQSIVDYGRWNPAINPVFRALSSLHWSSTTCHGYMHYAWLVNFYVGVTRLYDSDNKDDPYHVLAVRNAQ